MTSFENVISDAFFAIVTDDLYAINPTTGEEGPGIMTKEETEADLQNIFKAAIPGFEFPRFALYGFDSTTCDYEEDLTLEEVRIIANLMALVWLQRQITSIENTRQKASGASFKLTSQASHLARLLSVKEACEKTDRHAQRLYNRRKLDKEGKYLSNWSSLMETSALNGN